MARVGSRHTAPELLVRRILIQLGYRYRLHRKDLPGTPDIAFIGRKKAIFVHGCFWHGHECARGTRVPKTNTAYWTSKIKRNRARDAENMRRLDAMGWLALSLFECDLRDNAALTDRLLRFIAA